MKERLTGAIILVVLIVLLVPELLSGPKGVSAPTPAASGPNSSEEPPLRSYTINLGDDSHPRSEAAAGSNGPPMPQPSGPEQPTAQPSGGTSDGQADGAPTPTTTPPAPARAATSHTQTPTPSQSTARTQPTPRTANDTAPPAPKPSALPAPKPSALPAPKPSAPTPKPAAQIPKSSASAKSPKGHPSTGSSAAANTATSSESGWAVQLGVFASRENAERLALEVRVKGFKASVSPVTSGSRKLYRVRVGPTPDRAAAQELQGRLKAAGRPGGTVVPYS